MNINNKKPNLIESKYHALFESAHDAIILIRNKKIVDINPAGVKMFGFDYMEEIIGKEPWASDISTQYQPNGMESRKFGKSMLQSVKNGQNVSFEWTHIKTNGTEFWCEVSINTLELNDEMYLQAVARDITKRIKAEQSLKASEEQYRLLIDNIPDVTWSTDVNGKTNFISPNVKDVYGYTPKEIGRGGDKLWFGRVHKDDLKNLKNAYKSFFEEKGKFDIEYRIKHKNGKWIWLHDRAIMLRKEDKTQYAYGVFSDVTEHKQAIEARESALVEAEKANEIKANFLANMSHEIRTPLNAILGFTDLIKSENGNIKSEDLDRYIDIIQQSGNRLMHTVHGILDISQLETGTVNLNPEPVDLKKTISGLITALYSKANKKQLDLQFDTHLRKSTIMVDSYCVTQALEILIDNAIKYTERGSVKIDLKCKGKKHVVSIEDTGVGMSKEFMGRMFDPFTQESEGFSKKYQGMGIGLSLTKRYLKQISAELHVESSKGKGSTFTVIFNNPVCELRN